VAGAGNNWQETEAPALGSPTGSETVKVPDIPAPKPTEPEPAPLQPAPAEPEPLPRPVPAPQPRATSATQTPSPLDNKKSTYAEDIKRLSDKRLKKSMDKYRKQKAAEEAAAAKRMSKEEYDRQHPPKGGGSRIAKVDAKGIAGGVAGGSTANNRGGAGGKALSAEEASLLDRYFAFLKQRLRAAHTPPPGAGDLLSVEIEFTCAADGSLSRMHVNKSSGNSEFDESVIEAFRRVKGIGARPDGKSETLILTFDAKEE